jgi:hypothetical protein
MSSPGLLFKPLWGGGPQPFQTHGAAASKLPGSNVWMNTPAMASNALMEYIVQQDEAQMGPTNGYMVEAANEIWNSSWSSGFQYSCIGHLISYLPAGTQLFPFYRTTGTVPPYFAALAQINAINVCKAAWVATGRSADTFTGIMGSWWGGSGVTSSNLSEAQSVGYVPQAIAIAPYFDICYDTPIANCYLGAGTPGYQGGNWPVEDLNGLMRHRFYYGQSNWWNYHYHQIAINSYVASNPAILDVGGPGRPQLITYEGGVEENVPTIVPYQGVLIHDMMSHPSYYNSYWAWYISCQNGDPTTPGGGCSAATAYQALDPPSLGWNWMMLCGTAQPVGYGLTNQYAMDDGHSHYLTNQAPAMQALRDLNAITSPSPTPVSPARRWFSGLRRPSIRLGR